MCECLFIIIETKFPESIAPLGRDKSLVGNEGGPGHSHGPIPQVKYVRVSENEIRSMDDTVGRDYCPLYSTLRQSIRGGIVETDIRVTRKKLPLIIRDNEQSS